MLIIDWNQKRSYGVRTYIKRRIVDGKEEIHFANPKRGYVELIHFLNFPQLHITENQVVDCIFENCGAVNKEFIPLATPSCKFRPPFAKNDPLCGKSDPP